MQVISRIIKPIAKFVNQRVYKTHKNGIATQERLLIQLISQAKNTQFAREYNFGMIKSYTDFKQFVPLFDYEKLSPYIYQIIEGNEDVLWKGKPLYFAKTSGTTSGAKYIPISKESIGTHIAAARNALFAYVAETGNASFFDKKMIFIQGSPLLKPHGGILTGRLSGIVYHHVPKWLLKNRKPSYDSNCIEDWTTKINAIVSETLHEDMSVIGGIPPWCISYFKALLQKANKQNLKQVFPDLQLYVFGGLNYAPYKKQIDSLLGEQVDCIETYPASEGFFAYQDSQKKSGLLLNLSGQIFYEFIETASYSQKNPERISLKEVKCYIEYVLVVSTNAGLWAYNTGDTIKFVSLSPYRIVVTGRLKHFISAFGEHVIQKEVETAIATLAKEKNIGIREFTVAPYIGTPREESYHEWFIEFIETPQNIAVYEQTIDESLRAQNPYYDDLRTNKVLACAKITEIKKGGFNMFFVKQGKLGGQNKVQHLSNDRSLVNALKHYVK